MNPIVRLHREKIKGAITPKERNALLHDLRGVKLTYSVSGFEAICEEPSVVQDLKRAFPGIPWRVIECHDRERTYAALAWKDPDPREAAERGAAAYLEMAKKGAWDSDGVYHRRKKPKAIDTSGVKLMGQWNISIHGTGAHHNGSKLPEDANRMAADFVKQLRAAGHTVTKAMITYGGEEDVTDAETYAANYAPKEPA